MCWNHKLKLVYLFLSCFIFSGNSFSDVESKKTNKELDLSSNIGHLQATVTPGLYKIKFKNLVPGERYKYELKVEMVSDNKLPSPSSVITPSLPSAASKSQDGEVANIVSTVENGCTTLVSAKDKLLDAKEEKDVESLVVSLERELEESQCYMSEVINQAKKTMERTEFSTDEINIGSGEKVTVTMERGEGDKLKSWSYTLETKKKGRWVASWGLSILPNEDEGFVTKDNGSGGFVVTEKNSSDELDLVPTVFYTYQMFQGGKNGLSQGPTLGLGLDQEDLAAFLGWNWTYRQRIGITLGVAVHKQERLLGEFDEGEVLSANTSTLTEETYQQNYFLSLIYSFGN